MIDREKINNVFMEQILLQLGLSFNVIGQEEATEYNVIVSCRDLNESSKRLIVFNPADIIDFQQGERSFEDAKDCDRPICDIAKLKLLERIGEQSDLPIPFIELYPHNKKSALLLTHDVEWRITLDHLLKSFLPLEEKRNIRSTLFFRPLHADYSPPNAKILRSLRGRGFEIAVHGDKNPSSGYKSDDSLENIIHEKRIIESLLDQNVFGHALHGGRMLNKNINFYHIAGYEYERTLLCADTVRNIGKGFPYGTAWPWHVIFNNQRLDLISLPCHFQEGYWIDPTISLGTTTLFDLTKTVNPLRPEVTAHLSQLLDVSRIHRSTLGVIFHPEDFVDANQLRDIYENFLNDVCKDDIWITTSHNLCDWWKRRENTKFDYQFKKGTLYIRTSPLDEGYFSVLNKEKISKIVINGKTYDCKDALPCK